MHPLLLDRVVAEMEAHPWRACTVLIAKQEMESNWNDWTCSRIAGLPLSLRPGPFAAWRRELREEMGGFDERFTAAGDKEFWHRITRSGVPAGLVPQILYLYTRNPGSLSQSLRQSERWQKEKALLQNLKLEWPRPLRWRIRLIRLLRRFVPLYGAVPVAAPRALVAA